MSLEPETAATKTAPCEECGQLDASPIAGRQLCPDCIALAGCGCAGPADDEG